MKGEMMKKIKILYFTVFLLIICFAYVNAQPLIDASDNKKMEYIEKHPELSEKEIRAIQQGKTYKGMTPELIGALYGKLYKDSHDYKLHGKPFDEYHINYKDGKIIAEFYDNKLVALYGAGRNDINFINPYLLRKTLKPLSIGSSILCFIMFVWALSLSIRNRKIKYVPFIVMFLHASLVGLFSFWIYSGMDMDPESCMVWILFMFIDFPVSMIVPLFLGLIGKIVPIYVPYDFVRVNYFGPYIIYLIFGSLQYFFITKIIILLISKLKKIK